MGDFEDVKGIAAPARRALASAGVRTVADLSQFTEAEVKSWHGVGPTVIEALRGLLKARGLDFAR